MRARNLTFAALALLVPLLPGSLQESGAQSPESAVRRNEETIAPVYFDTAERETLAAVEMYFARGRAEGWSEAIRKIQGLVEQFGGKLVLVDEDEGRYVNFASHVFEKIRSDEAAFKEYRRQFDGTAARLLKEARETADAEPLVKIVRTYLPSSRSDEAYMLLAERAREMGDFTAADWFLRKIERLGGASDVPREMVAARRAASLAGLGDVRALEALAAGLSEETAKKEILALGRKETLKDFIDAAIKQAKTSPILPRAGRGEEPYAAPLPKSAPVETLLFSAQVGLKAEIFAEDTRPNAPKPSLENYWKTEFGEGYFKPTPYLIPYFPLGAGDRIYSCHGSDVEAFDKNGAFKWEKHISEEKIWMGSSPFGGTQARMTFPYGERYFQTARAGRVFTVMDSEYQIGKITASWGPFGGLMNAYQKRRVRVIMCLDAKSGKLKWLTGGGDEKAPLREVSFCAPPTFYGDKAYAIGFVYTERRTKDYALYCLDFNSGRLLWKADLYQMDESALLHYAATIGGKAQLPAVSGGDIFITTDEGATMCVSALDGRIDWLVRYKVRPLVTMPSIPSPQSFWYEIRPQTAGGLLLAASADCPFLIAHEPDTGKILWKWDNEAMLCSYVLGIHEGTIYLAGGSLVKLELATGKLLAEPQAFHASPIGRPCMSDEFVYVPARGGILIYDRKSAKLVSIFSFKTMSTAASVDELPVGMEEYTGNLAIFDGMLIALNPARLSAFGRR